MHGLVSFVANYGLIIPIVGLLAALLTLDSNSVKKRFLLELLGGALIVFLLARLGSWLYYNPRPFVVGHFTPYFPHPNNNGFPSDHTLFVSYIAFFVLSYKRKLGVALVLVALAIGLARVVAGVHHLVDILGAITISGLAVAVLHLMRQRTLKLTD